MSLKSRFTCTSTHTCCFYSGSTHPHTSTPFHLQIHPKLFYSYPRDNSQKHYPIPLIPREINARDILVTTTCYIIPGGWVLWKKWIRGNKKGQVLETLKKRKSETRGKNGHVSDSRIRGTRYPPERKEKENIEHFIPLKKTSKCKKGMYPLKRAKVELDFHHCFHHYHHHHHKPFFRHTCTSWFDLLTCFSRSMVWLCKKCLVSMY